MVSVQNTSKKHGNNLESNLKNATFVGSNGVRCIE